MRAQAYTHCFATLSFARGGRKLGSWLHLGPFESFVNRSWAGWMDAYESINNVRLVIGIWKVGNNLSTCAFRLY